MSWFREMAAVAVASVAAVLMIGVPAVAGSPFSSLVGAWSGNGTAHLEGGRSERLSCKGYYSGAGANQLRLNIICANPSTKVELRSVLTYAGGHVSGTWEERNYNQTGNDLRHSVRREARAHDHRQWPERLLSVSIGGANQSVSLSTKGSTLKGVNITFARTG